MNDLFQLPNPLSPQLENKKLPVLRHTYLDEHRSLFEAITERDVLLHFPYQTYDYVLQFFNEAALDPFVDEIKVTFYRVASDSFITNALISAANNGKRVTAFLEIKARFDEENNLKWAERMEAAGVNIIYSMPGLKVHAKVALVTKIDSSGGHKKFAYFGTGNFNEKTASIYADEALLTCHNGMTDELDSLFEYLDKRGDTPPFQHLLVSQFNIVDRFKALIDREIDHALKGKEARITVKVNSLEDKGMIDKLYEANKAGVQIDLMVRGIVRLKPGIEEASDNIILKRLVDRYLEHARVFYFWNDGDEEIFMGSADWMKRNLYRRIEVIFPLYDPDLKQEMKRLLELQFKDNTKCCYIDDTLRNVPVPSNASKPVHAQIDFHTYLSEVHSGIRSEE